MATRTITGVAGIHSLDGPGHLRQARIGGSAPTAGVIWIRAPGVKDSFAAGSAAGTIHGYAVDIPQSGQVFVELASANDRVEVEFSGPFG